MTLAKPEGVRTISIPEIGLGRMNVTLDGVTPLITHRFGDKAIASIEDNQQGNPSGRIKKPPRKPEEEFRDGLYVIEEPTKQKPGVYGFPAGGIKKAVVSAGFRFADETGTVLRGLFTIEGTLLPIVAPEPVMRTDNTRLGGKTATVSYRPEFDPWQIVVPVIYNNGMISRAQVLNLFRLAGFSVGIGDWRPEKSGTFGQFRIGSVEELEER